MSKNINLRINSQYLFSNSFKPILVGLNRVKNIFPLNLFRANTNYLFVFLDSHVLHYPVPVSLIYAWSFGSLAGICLVIQIISGIFFVMHYTLNIELVFNSVEYIIRDVPNGWLIRYIYANGASMFFIVMYTYIGRGLSYGSYMKPRELLWCFGVILLLLMMGTAFTSYALLWEQMSFWRTTMSTIMVIAISVVGQPIVQWLWGGHTVSRCGAQFYFFSYIFSMNTDSIAGLKMLLLSHLIPCFWFGDAAVVYQQGFQDPATITMEDISLFKSHFLFIIVGVVIVVCWLFFLILINSTESDKSNVAIFKHLTLGKVHWIDNSVLILLTLILLFPLIFLSYDLDEISSLELNLEIFIVDKTMCMDLPFVDPAELVATLVQNEVTRPEVEKWNLVANLEKFQTLVKDLHWEFWQSRNLADNNEKNSEVLEKIRDQITPELWGQKINNLNQIIDQISRAYFSIELILRPKPNPYQSAMIKHLQLLEAVKDNVKQSREDLKLLEQSMVNLRKKNKIVLPDNFVLDSIIVPKPKIANLINSMSDSISTITPPQSAFELPLLSYNDLIRELLNDNVTKSEVLSTKVQNKIRRFRKIAENLNWQLSRSREFLYSDKENPEVGQLIMKDLENPRTQQLIRNRLVPERWDYQLEDMQLLVKKVSQAYLRIDSTLECNSRYTVPMKQHVARLKSVHEAMYKAVEDLRPLQDVMMTIRTEDNIALVDGESLPDSISIDMPNINNLPESIDESVSTLTSYSL